MRVCTAHYIARKTSKDMCKFIPSYLYMCFMVVFCGALLNLLLFLVVNQTTKPVFDAILEATGENGRSQGKSFDDFRMCGYIGRVKTGDEQKVSPPVFERPFFLRHVCALCFTLEDPKRKKHRMRAVLCLLFYSLISFSLSRWSRPVPR